MSNLFLIGNFGRHFNTIAVHSFRGRLLVFSAVFEVGGNKLVTSADRPPSSSPVTPLGSDQNSLFSPTQGPPLDYNHLPSRGVSLF